MQHQKFEQWRHHHNYEHTNVKGERNTFYVLIITAITMVAEITVGTLSGSMALLADGWHMATHVAAFLITLFAYHYARKHAQNPDFSFGTGKVNVLGGFASAIALSVVAILMLVESIHRLMEPESILFNEAILVAFIGLAVNLISAVLLKGDHHGHNHSHAHSHAHEADHQHDHNLYAAYMHVLADALTSVLAIVALLAGKYFGLNWLDPIMGIVGAIIITRWSIGLIKQTSPILLDNSINESIRENIVATLESDADNQVCDIHIWKVGANHYAAIIAIVTEQPQTTEHYKKLLTDFTQLSHITIEVNQCFEKCPKS